MVTNYIHGLCFATEFLEARAREVCLGDTWLFLWSEDMKVAKAPEIAFAFIRDANMSRVSMTVLSRTSVVWHRLAPAHDE